MRRLLMTLTVGLVLGVSMATATTATADATQVEVSLLALFGMPRRPRAVDRARANIPAAMLQLYRRQNRAYSASVVRPGLHARNANTVRSFTHVESPIDARFPGHHRFRLFFNVSTIPRNEKLKASEVTLTREVISWSADNDAKEHLQQVLVHDIVRPGIKGKQEPILRLIDSKLADTRLNGTFSLDVLPAVQRWLESPKSNHGILVQVIGLGANKTTPATHLRLRRYVEEDSKEWVNKQPLLFTYTDDGRNKEPSESIVQRRARRASARHKSKRKEGKDICKRHNLYVDFTDVGWNDWIVAPPGYDAYYCSGDCPFPLADHLNTTNHAVVQTLMNSVSPQSVPKACCVPTTLNSISMLYLDDENRVVLKNYQDMTVIGCGCR